ncbi:P-loop containing nucleoside triphosphate hydrolase protein [Suillus paluster]|uniref:P-loop containing nucleoside triphosphate hydrolase protein n=1 Tax=Suillus paluster TaxID=48578 RepID=UPI001B86C8C4|nr:P-loop containing nucleoside triphosphate hydrolase protein [Suillus paluster]KAG1736080.1 P-loop containing nucleoside triphosphate hydrolase protein [Suillus paluster]
MPPAMPFPALPSAPSWFPGHMNRFTKQLPALLSRTDVVLELRDSRLPLTSINNNLEGAINKWRAERGHHSTQFPPFSPLTPANSSLGYGGPICERIVVLNKRDFVPEWGVEPFRRAMKAKFPDQTVHFASCNKPRDIKSLSEMLVSIAKRNPHATEMNVLVIGMPNVGKSTLLNSLRNMGISGRTPKALQTSAQPGHTRALSTRLKLSEDPLVYSYDSPGVMLPFLGRGDRGAERGVKLALIAGIKESLYDVEALVAYLLYRLNVLNPISPAYLTILPPGTRPFTDADEFLEQLAIRLNMLLRGGEKDTVRAAKWFVEWWRNEGGLVSASVPENLPMGSDGTLLRRGWGFDFEWTVDESMNCTGKAFESAVQIKMEECIDESVRAADEDERSGVGISTTQERKRGWQEKQARRAAKSKAKWAARKAA